MNDSGGGIVVSKRTWIGKVGLGLTGALAALVVPADPVVAQTRYYEWSATRYEATFLDDGSDPWHAASVEVGARRVRLSAVGRVNYASRFGREAVQIEGEAYPAWPGLGYAYLALGWSPEGAPFPEVRAAAEFFAALPSAFEASLGYIHNEYEGGAVPIWAGSLGKYVGNYWLSVRPYWLPEQEELSVALVGRRYLHAGDEFVTMRLVRGTAPETLASAADAARVESYSLIADAQLRVARRWLVLPQASFTTEELSGDRSRVRGALGMGVMYRF